MRQALNVNDRRIIDGNREQLDLMNLANLKHPVALDIYDEMRANVWSHTENTITNDKGCYDGYGDNALEPNEKIQFDKNLARLSNLDGIQMSNISLSIMPHITSPEYIMALTEQASQEAVHVRTYTKCIDTYSIDADKIHSMYLTDELLHTNNKYILKLSKSIREDYSRENFAMAIVYNVCLEWMYFNTGFLNFYCLGRRNKMRYFIKDIRLIHRDERIHGLLFLDMWRTLKIEYPEIFSKAFLTEAMNVIKTACEHETIWTDYLVGDGALGLTVEIAQEFVKHRANECSKGLGLGEVYPGVKNPVKWFDSYSQIGLKQNFFETKSDNYQSGTLGTNMEDKINVIPEGIDLSSIIASRIRS